jgi:hypothetical protein
MQIYLCTGASPPANEREISLLTNIARFTTLARNPRDPDKTGTIGPHLNRRNPRAGRDNSREIGYPSSAFSMR